jgi:hypothetical protein
MFNQAFLKIIAVIAIVGFTLSSCDRHTCPTYSQSQSVTADPKA